jgi:hypothetical protein
MGCNMNFLTYLIAKEVLPKERCRILDLGTSILVGATRENCREVLEYFLGDAARDVDQVRSTRWSTARLLSPASGRPISTNCSSLCRRSNIWHST